MSKRTHYPPGVPCWVDTMQTDPDAAIRFYAGLFGWEFVGPGQMPATPAGRYFVARVRGRDVAGVSSQPASAPGVTAWNTYVAVDDANAACAKVSIAGGTIIYPPFDAAPAGRMAVVADRAGAILRLWEAKDRAGAQIVNEPSAWAMNVLHTTDLDDAKRFYGEVFGWQTDTFDAGGTPMTLWRLPGYVGGEPRQPVPRDVVAIMVPLVEDHAANAPHWSVDFWIDNVDRAAATASKLGGRVVAPPHDAPGFRRCVITDPQGAIFSLSQLTGF
jgi:predicted enzyme related to lactoylglutathione lyase